MRILNFSNPYKDHWFLFYYKRKTEGDYLSHQSLEFKKGNQAVINVWIKLSIDAITERIKNDGMKIDYCIRSLGSKEIRPNDLKPLHKLGLEIEEKLKIPFIPQLVHKSKITEKFASLHSQSERENAIKDAFRINSEIADLSNKTVLILDDILTTGTTVKEIIKAIKNSYKGSIKFYVFTLGKTESAKPNSEDLKEKFKTLLNKVKNS